MTLDVRPGNRRSSHVVPTPRGLLASHPSLDQRQPIGPAYDASETGTAFRASHGTDRRFVALCLVIDIILTLGALRLAELLYRDIRIGLERRTEPASLDPRIYFIAAVIWALVIQFLPVFDVDHPSSLRHQFAILFKAVVVCVLALVTIFYLFAIPPSRLFFVYFWVFDFALLVSFYSILAVIQTRAHARGRSIRNVIVVGTGSNAEAAITAIAAHAWSGLRVVGVVGDETDGEVACVPVLGGVAMLPSLLNAGTADEVIIALPSTAHSTVVRLSHELQRFPVTVKVVPDVLDVFLVTSAVDSLWGVPLMSVRQPAIVGTRWLCKRALDIGVSAVVLVLAAPLMFMISIAIWQESGLPILFRQARVGKNGRIFRMLKFRSMRVEDKDTETTSIGDSNDAQDQTAW